MIVELLKFEKTVIKDKHINAEDLKKFISFVCRKRHRHGMSGRLGENDIHKLIDIYPRAKVLPASYVNRRNNLEYKKRIFGVWALDLYNHQIICSNCYKTAVKEYSFCPNCGAEMDIKESENAFEETTPHRR